MGVFGIGRGVRGGRLAGQGLSAEELQDVFHILDSQGQTQSKQSMAVMPFVDSATGRASQRQIPVTPQPEQPSATERMRQRMGPYPGINDREMDLMSRTLEQSNQPTQQRKGAWGIAKDIAMFPINNPIGQMALFMGAPYAIDALTPKPDPMVQMQAASFNPKMEEAQKQMMYQQMAMQAGGMAR